MIELFFMRLLIFVVVWCVVALGYYFLARKSILFYYGIALSAVLFVNDFVASIIVSTNPQLRDVFLCAVIGAITATFAAFVVAMPEDRRVRGLKGAVKKYIDGESFASCDENVVEPYNHLHKAINELVGRFSRRNVELVDWQDGRNYLSKNSKILTQFASNLSQQGSAITEIDSTAHVVREMSAGAAEKAQRITKVSEDTLANSRHSVDAKNNAINSINEIKSQVEQIVSGIEQLKLKTRAIADIIETVSDIAEQSNLLAVNASIEAAKAGEYGKGFAVVAAEVKNLSTQSKQAAVQVKQILNEIRNASDGLSHSAEAGSIRVLEGIGFIQEASKAVDDLAVIISESAHSAQEIYHDGLKQLAGIEQLVTAISEIKKATDSNLAIFKEAQEAADNFRDSLTGTNPN